MKKIAFLLYREWASEIYNDIVELQKERGDFEIPVLITIEKPDIQIESLSNQTKKYVVNPSDNDKIESILREGEIDLAIYYGWSWLVREPILSNHICVCLHPSKLPMYRGGSPIQNQIISGENESSITVFRMGVGLDDGPIYQQIFMSLEGEIKDIFWRMQDTGKVITRNLITDLINDDLFFNPQVSPENYPPCVRRKPCQSELKLEKIEKMSFNQLNNFIRALTDPYPNAYVMLHEKKFIIRKLLKFKSIKNGQVLNECQNSPPSSLRNCYFKLLDSYAKVSQGELINTSYGKGDDAKARSMNIYKGLL
jgi:methionyl-tRNA formyltransferase